MEGEMEEEERRMEGGQDGGGGGETTTTINITGGVERGTENDNDGTGLKVERGRADDYNNNDDYGDDNDDDDNKEADDNNKRRTITTTTMTTTTKIKGECSCRAENGRGWRRRRIVIASALLLPREDVCYPTSEERTMPQPPLCPRRRRCRRRPRPRRAGRAPIENIAPKNDTRWRGVAPLPPPPSASHSSFVEGTRQGRSPRLPCAAGGARRPHVRAAAPRGGAAALGIMVH